MSLLILTAWLLPIMLIVGGSGYINYQNSRLHVTEVVEVSVENAMTNISADLDSVVNAAMDASYIPTVREAYARCLRDGDWTALYASVHRFLEQQYSRKPLLCGAHLIFEGQPPDMGHSIYTFNPSNSSFFDVAFFYQSDAPAKAQALINEIGSDVTFLYEGGRLYLVRAMSLLSNRFSPYAALVLEVDLPILAQKLSSVPWVTQAQVQLSGASFPLVGGAPPALPEEQSATDTTLFLSDSRDGERFSLAYEAAADLTPLLEGAAAQLRVIFLLALLGIPLVAIVIVFFTRKITHPMHTLQALTNRIEEGELGAQVDASSLGSAEFCGLGANLNAMSARLSEQFERIYREELALRDAQLKALQSQINPHFLGNTLEIVNWEARLAGNDKVSQMLEALSTMMDASLDRSRAPLIHLAEEMMYVNSYLYIIGERFGKRLTVQTDIPPELLSHMVPRLILQPIVENAVEHGVSLRQKGSIVIRARALEAGWVALEVENDSPLSAQNEAKVAQLLCAESAEGESSANIGIRNVHLRLRMLYGPTAELSIKNTKSGSTLSAIRIGPPPDEQNRSR